MPTPSVIMRKLLTNILCVAFAMCLVACNDGDDDDGGYIPPYITDFLVASTGADGKVVSVRLDDGTTHNVASQQVDLEHKDTLFRCMATYTLEKGKNLKLYGIQPVFSYKPYKATSIYVVINGQPYQDVSLLPRDPMKVISMWKAGGYLNLHLGLMTTNQGVHQYIFAKIVSDTIPCCTSAQLMMVVLTRKMFISPCRFQKDWKALLSLSALTTAIIHKRFRGER